MRRAVLLIALAGCDSLLHLTNVPPPVDAAPLSKGIHYIQSANGTPTMATTMTVPFTRDETAGSLNVVFIGWNGTADVASVGDSAGNTYELASTISFAQSVYFAANVAGGPTSVNVTFAANADSPDVRILEYGGIATVDPMDQVTGLSSPGSIDMSSGQLTTRNAYDLLVAGAEVGGRTTVISPGFSQREYTSGGNIAEDMIVDTTGNYTAMATQDSMHWWVMHMVAFKGLLASPP